MLYEQNAMAMAPAMAIHQFTPKDSISRNPPRRAANMYVAGLAPVSRNSYIGFVQSPSKSSYMVTFGMPPNIELVHAVLSSGWAWLYSIVSRAMPCHPEMSDWLTIFPLSTWGTKAYEITMKKTAVPMKAAIFFMIDFLSIVIYVWRRYDGFLFLYV